MIKTYWHGYEFGLGFYYSKIEKRKIIRVTFGWTTIDFTWGIGW